jgi:hypothetical protein
MISLRLVVPAVLIAAVVAGCFTYFVATPLRVETDQRAPPSVPDMKGPYAGIPTNVGQPKTAGEHASAYTRAAEAILKHAPDAQAFADSDRTLITGHIPLPKKRPIPRL